MMKSYSIIMLNNVESVSIESYKDKYSRKFKMISVTSCTLRYKQALAGTLHRNKVGVDPVPTKRVTTRVTPTNSFGRLL